MDTIGICEEVKDSVEVITEPVEPIEVSTPNPLTISLSGLSGALIGISTTITVFVRWYTRFIPILRKFIPSLLKTDLNEWLYNLSYRLIMRDENVKNNFSNTQIKNVLSNTDVLVDLIELNPNNITDYLSNYLNPKSNLVDELPVISGTELTQIEYEANELLRNLPDAPV